MFWSYTFVVLSRQYFAGREGKISQPEVIGMLSGPPDIVWPCLLGCKRGPVWDRNRQPSGLSSAPHWNWQNCFNRGRGGAGGLSLSPPLYSVTCITCIITHRVCFSAKFSSFSMSASGHREGILRFCHKKFCMYETLHTKCKALLDNLFLKRYLSFVGKGNSKFITLFN